MLMVLLASAQSSDGSTGGLTFPLLYAAAIGEMLVGTSSREASASSMVAWDDVSTGGSEAPDFWGGDIVTAAVVIFLREECLDSQLDASIIAQSRRSLTSTVKLPSNFGGRFMWISCLHDGGLTNRWCQGVQFLLGRDIDLQIKMLASNNTYTAA